VISGKTGTARCATCDTKMRIRPAEPGAKGKYPEIAGRSCRLPTLYRNRPHSPLPLHARRINANYLLIKSPPVSMMAYSIPTPSSLREVIFPAHPTEHSATLFHCPIQSAGRSLSDHGKAGCFGSVPSISTVGKWVFMRASISSTRPFGTSASTSS